MIPFPKGPFSEVQQLFAAIVEGQFDRVTRLLSGNDGSPVSPSSRDHMGQAAMTVAAYWGRTDMIRLMAAHGGDVNIRDDHIMMTALMETAINDRYETAVALLELGANVDLTNRYGNTALLYAVQTNHIKMARLLLEAGADPHIKNEHGATAFGLAREPGYEAMAAIFDAWARVQEDRRLQEDRERKAALQKAQKHHADQLSRLDRFSRRRSGKDKAP